MTDDRHIGDAEQLLLDAGVVHDIAEIYRDLLEQRDTARRLAGVLHETVLGLSAQLMDRGYAELVVAKLASLWNARDWE